MDDLLAEFLCETGESLAALDTALLTLERMPDDPDCLAEMFRLLHSIKGTSGFLSLPRLGRVAHATEDLLDAVRRRVRPADGALVGAVLAALDRLRALHAAIAATGREPPGEDDALVVDLEMARVAGPPAGPAEGRGAGAVQAAPAQTIRVSLEALESLLILVSELVLTRNQLLQLARSIPDGRLTAPLQRLSHLTSDLQEGAMRTRMQPISQAWSKLPRLVRDLSAELGKPISLVLEGSETELDRQVLELVRDPLTHMVRNSADHGLEAPAARLAAGKPEGGTIRLTSYHEGGHVVIEVADDGAGLQTDRIRQRAVALGLVTAAEAAVMADAQVHQLIFQPGLSTARTISVLSGRGVGMDVVKTNIERLGGTVAVRSTQGAGTVFKVQIPLTLAIISALIVSAGGQRFALPQASVAELVRVERLGTPGGGKLVVEYVDGTPVLRLRERLVPLIRLADLLGLAAMEGAALTVVIATIGGWTMGLVVDQVFDTEEIVVKPVSPVLRRLSIYCGNTILGDGSVIMILDPNGLAKAASRAETGPPSVRVVEAVAPPRGAPGVRSALLLVQLSAESRPAAVPLALIARIELIPAAGIVRTAERAMTQYRGQLMPLVGLAAEGAVSQGVVQGVSQGAGQGDGASVPALVFTEGGRTVGLVVWQIVDLVEEILDLTPASTRPGMLGTALIAGAVTEVIDTGHWLARGWRDWFQAEAGGDAPGRDGLGQVRQAA